MATRTRLRRQRRQALRTHVTLQLQTEVCAWRGWYSFASAATFPYAPDIYGPGILNYDGVTDAVLDMLSPNVKDWKDKKPAKVEELEEIFKAFIGNLDDECPGSEEEHCAIHRLQEPHAEQHCGEGVSRSQEQSSMATEGKAEKHREQDQFAAYKQFCDNTADEKKHAIEEATETFEALKADISKYKSDAENLEEGYISEEEHCAMQIDTADDKSEEKSQLTKSMKITAKTLHDSPFDLEVVDTDTVALVKRQIQQRASHEPAQQRLIFEGTELDDTRSLGSYAVAEGSTLLVILLEVKKPTAAPSRKPKGHTTAQAPASPLRLASIPEDHFAAEPEMTSARAYGNIRASLRGTIAAQTSEYIKACRQGNTSEPKRPASAYCLFCVNKEVTAAASALAASTSLAKVSKQRTQMWHECPKDIKEAFEEQASLAMEEYEAAKVRWIDSSDPPCRFCGKDCCC